jgi:Fur family peroxide stress response transcriptional regulator
MVSKAPNPAAELEIPDEISGLRMTRQRQHIYRMLLRHRDHPTANDVFMRIKDTLPNLSLATVYTCLDAMVKHGIIRQVNFDRGPSRFCPNLAEHGHFHDETTGVIHDVIFKPGVRLEDVLDLPPGTIVKNVEFTLRGQLA